MPITPKGGMGNHHDDYIGSLYEAVDMMHEDLKNDGWKMTYESRLPKAGKEALQEDGRPEVEGKTMTVIFVPEKPDKRGEDLDFFVKDGRVSIPEGATDHFFMTVEDGKWKMEL